MENIKTITIARIGSHKTIKKAAEELRSYLKSMDPDALIEIRSYEKYDETKANRLWVGIDEALEHKLKPVEDKSLDDAICIEVKDFSGIITGANERAVLIAAYRFLKELGVRWLCPGKFGEVVPKRSLDFCNVSVSEAPTSRHRTIVSEGAFGYEHAYNLIDWMPKVGMNGYFFQFITPKYFVERWYTHEHNENLEPEVLSEEEYNSIHKGLLEEISDRSLMNFAVGHGWTGKPFGLSDGWDLMEDSQIPDEVRQYLAMMNGKRQLFGDCAGNSNLCYSNPEVVHKIAKVVGDYCEEHPDVTYICVWGADARNNFCECETCRKLRPSDWIINIMNHVDEELERRGITTKVVFTPYNDLMWEPLEMKLKNPERFAMMFAPITRKFTSSLGDVDLENLPEIAPYELNNVVMPRTNPAIVKQIKGWDNFAAGDRMIYDYHCWSTTFIADVGGFKIARLIHSDIKAFTKLNLNGMHSCQVQRYSFPTNLPMQVMAETLWDNTLDFDGIAERYMKDAFGQEYQIAQEYLESISVETAYWLSHGEPEVMVDHDKKEQMQNGLAIIEKNRPVITRIFKEDNFENDTQRMFWKLLVKQLELAEVALKLQVRKFSGESIAERMDAIEVLKRAYQNAEPELHWFLDIWRQVVMLEEAQPVEDPH